MKGKMMGLTADQITALTNAGARRWQKAGYDRIYVPIRILGVLHTSQGDAFFGEEEVPSSCVPPIQNASVWVETATGRLNVRLTGIPEEHADKRERLTHLIRATAESWLSDRYGEAECLAAERRAKSIQSVALKWRKGNVVMLDGKRLTVVRADTLSSPADDKSPMICDARVIVRKFDGKYRRVDLNED